MADKFLDEAAWKVYSGKHDIKDTVLLKALGQLARAEKQGPAEVAEALDAVDKQIAVLTKERKADKDVTRQLDDMRKAAEARRKDAAKELKEQQARQGDESDEGDSPALLTSKMVPLLRELRKGEARMHALVGTAGKNTAVLIMRRAIAPARRKLLAEALDAAGGAKYIPAEVLFEQGAVTFVVKTQAGGLAKRVKTALLQQTAMRLKVRVRGEDPQDVDEDGEEGDDGEPDPGGRANGGDGDGDGGDAAATAPPSPAALAHAQRLRVLQPQLDQALRDQHPEVSRLRAVSAFAGEKATAGDLAAAGKALDMLEKLLGAAPPGTPAGGVPPAPPTPATDQGSTVKSRLTALVPRVREAVAAGVAGAQDARLKVSEAGVLAGKREFGRAAALLDDAEQLLAGQGGPDGQGRQDRQEPPDSAGEQALTGASRGEQAAREIEAARGKGHVRLKRLGIEWRQSLARSRDEADRLVQALSNHPQVVHDPRADEIRAKAPELLKQLPRFDGSLEAALQDLADAVDAAALQRSREQALGAVQVYLTALAANPMLRSMDDSFAGRASIYADMHGTLDGMRQLLEQPA